MPRFTALLFDMDGVLVDSEPLHEDAARQVLARHDLPVPDDLFDRFRGRPDRVLFADRIDAQGRADLAVSALVEEKEAIYATLLDDLHPRPGIIGLLEWLTDRGVPLACVTSATRADQEAVFDACGFGRYFEAVVTADDVDAPKPSPQPYERGAAQLNVAPSDCCVIEDSPYGLRAGREAGATTVGIPSSYDADVLDDASADFVARDTAALRVWLRERLA